MASNCVLEVRAFEASCNDGNLQCQLLQGILCRKACLIRHPTGFALSVNQLTAARLTFNDNQLPCVEAWPM